MKKQKKEGQLCPKCERQTLCKEFSNSKTFEWFLKCHECGTVYFVDNGRRREENKPSYQITIMAKSLANDNGDKLSSEYYIQAILEYLDNNR